MLKKILQSDSDVVHHSLDKLSGPRGDGKAIVFGRGVEVDFALDSARCPLLISRRHASICRRGTRLLISDCASTNGTYVNDLRLNNDEYREIKDGDTISFGGASKVRQISNAGDEFNPFLYRLKHSKRLFGELDSTATSMTATDGNATSSRGPVDLTPSCQNFPRANASSQQGIIDLTEDASSSLLVSPRRPLMPGAFSTFQRGNAPSNAPQTGSLKRSPAIVNLDDDSDGCFVVPPLRKTSARPSSIPISASKKHDNPTLKALEAEFECQICREFMIGAHSLVPCGHMFCGECACEWLDKKRTCPACRMETTSAPVPSIKVDNIIEEVAAPHMNKDTRAERDRRKIMWARAKATHTAKMEKLHKRAATISGQPRHILDEEIAAAARYARALQTSALAGPRRTLPGSDARAAAFTLPDATLFPFPGPDSIFPIDLINPRGQTDPSRAPSANANVESQPLRSLPPGHPMFCVVGRSNRSRGCGACNRTIEPQMPMILRSTGPQDQSAYHVGCEARIQGFLTSWTAMSGNIQGAGYLGPQNQARIHALARQHSAASRPGTRTR